MNRQYDLDKEYPVLATRREVVLPGVVVPLEVGRRPSIAAVDRAAGGDNYIILAPQVDPEVAEPGAGDLVDVGVLAEVLQIARQGANRYTIVVRTAQRVRLADVRQATTSELLARIQPLALIESTDKELGSKLLEHLVRVVADKSDGSADKVAAELAEAGDADDLVDLAAGHLELDRAALVALLIEADVGKRMAMVVPGLERLHQVIDKKGDIKRELTESTPDDREAALRLRLRAIAEELGEPDDESELGEYLERIAKAKMPDEVRKVAKKQVSRMRNAGASSPEHGIARTYLEWLLDLPWGVQTADQLDVAAARAILDADHSGLEKVKKRILEFIAVRKLNPDRQGPILCLVGPPGVGKTSLARSIASALERKYVRISLGGVRDESEIRGHRRTYIGALPGRIVSGLKKAGSLNPVFVLDEIDKLSADHRGDPAAAMLEVLDPKQNNEFVDHYLEVPVDLSRVMFVCTANQLDTIPGPLLDRLEVIHVAGYTEIEKLAIAEKHLVPKQLAEHGLEAGKLEITRGALEEVVQRYTREAGVRNLEREIASLCRDAAVKIAGGVAHLKLDRDDVALVLGPPRFESEIAEKRPEVGVVSGLGWTPVGGDLLFIEARKMPGKGKLVLTGQVGDVMSESAQAARSWLGANARRLGVPDDVLATHDLHLHIPAGGIKKDGPSAGIAMAIALTSIATDQPIRPEVAITGEISLRGLALPVGGIKGKVLAAHRAGSKIVILPERNRKDLADIPVEIQRELDIRFVRTVDEALDIALGKVPDRAVDVAASDDGTPPDAAAPPKRRGKRASVKPPIA
jgi:ATP-dependent Lon protease